MKEERYFPHTHLSPPLSSPSLLFSIRSFHSAQLLSTYRREEKTAQVLLITAQKEKERAEENERKRERKRDRERESHKTKKVSETYTNISDTHTHTHTHGR
jgi:hypothetical protein